MVHPLRNQMNYHPINVRLLDGPKGIHSITSGIEGPWTTEPMKWDNQYFYNLLYYDWEVTKGPGGHWQWKVKDDDNNTTKSPLAPIADPHAPN